MGQGQEGRTTKGHEKLLGVKGMSKIFPVIIVLIINVSCLLACYLYLNKAVFKIEKARRISTIIFLPVSKSLCNVNLQLQDIKSISPSFESGMAYGMCWK